MKPRSSWLTEKHSDRVIPFGGRLNHALSIAIAPDRTDISFFLPEDVRQYWQQWQERVALFWK